MSDLTISLLGIHNYLEQTGQTSFMDAEFFILPDSINERARATLTALILSESADLEAVYPEPDTLKTVVNAWSRARVEAWAKMHTALREEYNPLHNYDRHEQEDGTDTGTRTDTDSGTVTNDSNDTTTADVTGFNSSTFADDQKTTSRGTGTQTRNLTAQETRNLANHRELHVYGNIGVTTSAQMLAGELDVRQTDIINIIKDEFIRYFCIMVY